MGAIAALGTKLAYLPTVASGDTPIEIKKLTSIGEISPDTSEIDVTTLESAAAFREFLAGLKDSGELALAGYFDAADTGQMKLLELYGTGALGYFFVTFPDGSVTGFTAFVKGYSLGAAEVDGAVGFGATLRITGAANVLAVSVATKNYAVVAGAIAGAMAIVAASTLAATKTYQWYKNATATKTGGVAEAGATSASYNIPTDLTAGTYYFYCVVTQSGIRAATGDVVTVVVAAA
jgi:hypothetical protein